MVQLKTYLGESLQVFFMGVIELYNCCRLISYKGIMWGDTTFLSSFSTKWCVQQFFYPSPNDEII